MIIDPSGINDIVMRQLKRVKTAYFKQIELRWEGMNSWLQSPQSIPFLFPNEKYTIYMILESLSSEPLNGIIHMNLKSSSDFIQTQSIQIMDSETENASNGTIFAFASRNIIEDLGIYFIGKKLTYL